MTNTNTITQDDMTLEQKLEAIAKAMEEAQGNPQEEARLLNVIADPQDSLNCEGCQ